MVSNITEHVAVVNFYWGAIAKTDVLIHLQTQLHVLVFIHLQNKIQALVFFFNTIKIYSSARLMISNISTYCAEMVYVLVYINWAPSFVSFYICICLFLWPPHFFGF